MNFYLFKNTFREAGLFHINQILSTFPNFNRTNLTRWIQLGYLLKIRQGWYAFPETLEIADFSRYISSRIYQPSYISLHYALSFYGIIPEAVTDITCISVLKTNKFTNIFGRYFYYNIKKDCFWGYKKMTDNNHRTFNIAVPEKAILDLLYIYPFYNTINEILIKS